ncbi:hypothetical protein BA1DRAFT_03100 [Photorhabdus aegyptia]|uniref:YkuD domain-containing protein n=1 Tax=Photorhabdus aegyptia TaxID=2805098 RepID=A0A022PIL8_9GAMM|nr:hypothetical protein BA1DRAFT_03100 [Photorhabdus aegyptia]
MIWIYQQYSGEIYHDTKLIGYGWSSQGIYKNNPASEGCIILNRDIRREILLSHDTDLVVE